MAKKYRAFRIGGGNYETHTCLNLIINGQVVKSATGWRSDRLTPVRKPFKRFVRNQTGRRGLMVMSGPFPDE